MIRFELHRDVDATGVSGTGVVAMGVMWPDGRCALRWMTEHRSTCIYDSIEDVERIHGHHGSTRIVWVDPVKRETDERDWSPKSVCVMCFGGPAEPASNHCISCGASGAILRVPAWFANGMRTRLDQADATIRELQSELHAIKALFHAPLPVYASQCDEPGRFGVRLYDRRVFLYANSAEEARQKGAPNLSWVEMLRETNGVGLRLKLDDEAS